MNIFTPFQQNFFSAEQKASACCEDEKNDTWSEGWCHLDNTIKCCSIWFSFVMPVGMAKDIKKVLSRLQKNCKYKRRFLLNLGAVKIRCSVATLLACPRPLKCHFQIVCHFGQRETSLVTYLFLYDYDFSKSTSIKAVFIKYCSVDYFLLILQDVDKGVSRYNRKFSGDHLHHHRLCY